MSPSSDKVVGKRRRDSGFEVIDLCDEEEECKPAAKKRAVIASATNGDRGSRVVTPPANRGGDADAASLALARKLQKQFDAEGKEQAKRARKKDEILSRKLQKKFDEDGEQTKRAREKDEILSRKLQKQFDEDGEKAKKAREQAEKAMASSHAGKAVLFVQEVLDLVEQMPQHIKDDRISAVAKDDMVFLAEATLRLQEEFRLAGKPTVVDIGVHYTRSENMNRIRTDGLLTKADRDSRNIQSNYNGSALGDGIYTASDYVIGACYGDMGLLVARLKGVESTDMQRNGYAPSVSYNHDTYNHSNGSVLVLRKSHQCIPLVQFLSVVATGIGQGGRRNRGPAVLRSYQASLQKILDKYYNT